MKKITKLISFILSVIMALQAMNLSAVWADVKIDGATDEVVSGIAVDVDDYGISTFAENSEESDENTLQDIVLVLDDSGSMSSSDMSTLKEASIKFCEKILEANSGNRIAIVTFGNDKSFDFSSDINVLKSNINSLKDNGSHTYIHWGINTADEIFKNSWLDLSTKSMVIMSDGKPTYESRAKTAYDNVADKYKIYSVYFGSNSSAKDFMESIQNSGFYNAEDVDSLIEQFGKIADIILNPLEVVITHECTYNFLAQEYIVKAVIRNPNNKPVENIQLNLDLPQNVEPADGENVSKSIEVLSGKTSQEISWKIEIMQGKENESYNIVLKVKANDLISMNAEHKIFVEGYNNGDLKLDLSKDTWKFENYSSDSLNIDSNAFNGLLQTVNNTVKEELKEDIKTLGNGGHCYGMAATAILAKVGETSAGQISSGASCIHDIDLEDADETISYYHLTQVLPGIKEERTTLIGLSTEKQLEEIANKARLVSTGGTPVLLGLSLGEGGHAVVCYDYKHIEDKTNYVTVAGNTYNSYLSIYDPNDPDVVVRIYFNSNVDENSNIVTVNDSNYLDLRYLKDGWYTGMGINYFKYAINNISIINLKDLENMSNNYSAWLRVKTYQNMKRLEVHNNFINFGIEKNGISGNNNIIGFFDDSDVNSTEKYYNVKLENDKNYNITAEDLSEFDISLMYKNYYLAAKADNAKGISFDYNGGVQLNGSENGYALKLTANDGYTSLPWYTVTVEGEKAENPYLQITDEGYLFEGEELSNIKVTANNDTETKELVFDSDKTSVLITNEDDNLIVKEDSDNDGVYDKVIADSDNEVTETTTKPKNYGGGGAGSSSLKVINYNETGSEETTEITTEATTEDENKGTDFTQVKVTIGSNVITINDKEYEMEAAPYIQAESNSTLVPLRFVAIALLKDDVDNADNSSVISWDPESKAANIYYKGKTIQFHADSDTMIIAKGVMVENIKKMDNGVKAEIKDGRMYIPFRALGEALGADVEWDAETRTAIYNINN